MKMLLELLFEYEILYFTVSNNESKEDVYASKDESLNVKLIKSFLNKEMFYHMKL